MPWAIVLPRIERLLEEALREPRQVPDRQQLGEIGTEQRVRRARPGLERPFRALAIGIADVVAAGRELQPEVDPRGAEAVIGRFEGSEAVPGEDAGVPQSREVPGLGSLIPTGSTRLMPQSAFTV